MQFQVWRVQAPRRPNITFVHTENAEVHPVHFRGWRQAKNKCGRLFDVQLAKLTSCEEIPATEWGQYWTKHSVHDHTSHPLHSQQRLTIEWESSCWSAIQIEDNISSKLTKIREYLHVLLIIAKIWYQLYRGLVPGRNEQRNRLFEFSTKPEEFFLRGSRSGQCHSRCLCCGLRFQTSFPT